MLIPSSPSVGKVAPLRGLPTAPAGEQPGKVRDFFEKGAGVIGGLGRTPTSLISGLAIGGYHGARRGADAEHTINPRNVALGLVASNGIQSVAKGAALGFMMFGPAGAALNGLKEAGQSSASLYLFLKGGSAEEMGKQMTAAIEAGVESGGGTLQGIGQGVQAGVSSAVRSGFSTGYQEGRAAAHGAFEGLEQIPKEFKGAGLTQKTVWGKALAATAGTLAAVGAAPAGLALAASQGTKVPARLASAGAGAATGAALGLAIAGPVGLAVGAVIGGLVGTFGPTSKPEFQNRLNQSLERARQDDMDLGTPIANRRADLVQRCIVGTLSGARQGWDAGTTR